VDPYCSSFICHLLVYQLTIHVSTYAIFKQELVNTNPSLFTFSLLVLTMMLGSSHIGPLTWRFANQCSPAGYREKHTLRPYRGTNGTNLLSSCQENRVSIHTGTLSPRPLAMPRPPNTIYNPPSVGPDGARTHDKRITSLSSPHPLVYARDKEICDLTTI
jgi:hypothetical protein